MAKAKFTGGRPSLLTDEKIEMATKVADAGATDETVSRCIGVSYRCAQKWKARGALEIDRIEEVEERITALEGRLKLNVITEHDAARMLRRLKREAKTLDSEESYLRFCRALVGGKGRFVFDMLSLARKGAAAKNPELALKMLAMRGGAKYQPPAKGPAVEVNVAGDGKQDITVMTGSMLSQQDLHDCAAMAVRRAVERKAALRKQAREANENE